MGIEFGVIDHLDRHTHAISIALDRTCHNRINLQLPPSIERVGICGSRSNDEVLDTTKPRTKRLTDPELDVFDSSTRRPKIQNCQTLRTPSLVKG